MSNALYQMQARSSSDNALYTWRSTGQDWGASGYTGPGSALEVVVLGGGFELSSGGVPDGAMTFDDGSYVVFDDGSYAVTP